MNSQNTQDKYSAAVEKYINDYAEKKKAFSKGHKQKLRNHLPMSLKYFAEHNILSPSQSDFDMLMDFISKQPIDNKGTLPSAATVKDRVDLAIRFYKFYNRTKGDVKMSTIETDKNAITEPEAQSHAVIDSDSEVVINPEVESLTNESETEATGTQDKDSSLSGVTRGRKPKPANEKRTEKINVYLTPSLYADIKDLAYFSKRELSEVFLSLASEFVDRNRTTLEAFRKFAKNAGTIE